MASLPYGAMPDDTGEFFLGRVVVTPVLLESSGGIDPSTENWNANHINQVLANLNEGLDWWTDLLATKTSVHSLSFQIDTTYAVNPSPTVYEPINRISNDYDQWVPEFLNRVGFNQSTDIDKNIYAFNDAQRTKYNADWAFTVFVVNSQAEQDGTFAPGGNFSRAFAFAGGLFFVTPSTRPASTYAHETGHMFWARDEYSGGGNYSQRRGYYNTQNLNAIDQNSVPNFQQATSIMSAGGVLQNAYDQLVSPPSTLAMVGWQDSDSDGVFDVLDVPLMLDGVGKLDTATGSYQFRGSAKTRTLPNLNSSGLQNDITFNRISRIEYRVDGGAWTTSLTPNAYEVDLNFSIPVPIESSIVEIRAIDAQTQVTSNLFRGTLGAKADSTATSNGIAGFAWSDLDSDGIWDSNESPRTGFTVRLVDGNGQVLNTHKSVEPDDKGIGEIPSDAYAGASLSAVGLDTDGSIGIFTDIRAVTGSRVFRPYSIASQDFAPAWRGDRQQLRIDFQSRTSYVSVDVAGAETGAYARLEIYSSAGVLLDRVTTGPLNNGQSSKLELGRTSADVAYAIVKGHMGTSILIDDLSYGPNATTKIDSQGRYAFPNILPGTYNVQIVLPTLGYTLTSPQSGIQSVTTIATQASTHVDFGVHYNGSPWTNDILASDVNHDGSVTPLDALLVINQLNLSGSMSLDGSGLSTSPFIDVSNDRMLTPLDALQVINYLNLNGIGGEGELAAPGVGAGAASSGGAMTADGESSIEPVWDRYVAEVGPLIANQDFIERLEMPRWTEPIPCNCPYCASFG